MKHFWCDGGIKPNLNMVSATGREEENISANIISKMTVW